MPNGGARVTDSRTRRFAVSLVTAAALVLTGSQSVALASGPMSIRAISQYQGWTPGSSYCDCGPTSVAMAVYYLDGGYPSGITNDKDLVGRARTNTGTSTNFCTDT